MGSVQKIVHSIGKIPGCEALFKCLFKNTYNKYMEKKNQEQKDLFLKYGKEALAKFNECMNKNNFYYTLAFGSVLGAIREHGFIKHDFDIDVYLWIEDFTPKIIEELQKCGFIWERNYSIDNDKYGREDTVVYKGVHIDMFYLYPPINKYPYSCLFVPLKNNRKRLPYRLEMPIEKNRMFVDFEDMQIPVPTNADEICRFRYGPDYMIPNPGWNWIASEEATVKWYDKEKLTTWTEHPKL